MGSNEKVCADSSKRTKLESWSPPLTYKLCDLEQVISPLESVSSSEKWQEKMTRQRTTGRFQYNNKRKLQLSAPHILLSKCHQPSTSLRCFSFHTAHHSLFSFLSVLLAPPALCLCLHIPLIPTSFPIMNSTGICNPPFQMDYIQNFINKSDVRTRLVLF